MDAPAEETEGVLPDVMPGVTQYPVVMRIHISEDASGRDVLRVDVEIEARQRT
jgi:hypothetical protein